MANALKCDRCGGYYDYDSEVEYNYISYGHKDIIPNKRPITVDICPKCMEAFKRWFDAAKEEVTEWNAPSEIDSYGDPFEDGGL